MEHPLIGWMAVASRVFSIDPRSLAFFRIAIGIVLLVDLAIRANDLSAMYTDDGMFSRTLICRHYTDVWNWSFHFGGGSLAYQAILFGFSVLFAIAMVIGFETRIATILSWLMLVSLHNRVPPILNGSDNLHRMLLFWAMFLPIQRVWSVDAWMASRRSSKSTPPPSGLLPVSNAATAAILLQMAFIYFFSAISKTNSDWLSGRAIEGILAHDFYARSLGSSISQFNTLLAVITIGILALEWVAPLLLFSPWRTAQVRLGVLALLVAMHTGIEMLLEVGLFSFVSVAGLTLFLPREFWNNKIIARFTGSSVVPTGEKSDKVECLPDSRLALGVCIGSLLYVFAVNINGLSSRPLSLLKLERWGLLWTAAGFGQKWHMFDEVPSKDGWQVAHATLADGSEVDLLRAGTPVDWHRPSAPYLIYPNHRWRKLFREVAYFDALGFQVFRVPIGQYLCRKWNADRPVGEHVTSFELVYCMEEAEAASSHSGEPVREVLVHLDFDYP
ncbi:MAG: HTTM domain-containing protein [Verrucomicrobiales bacterium]